MPEISVIVPIYNREKFLNRCVDSILAQTFYDMEIILVDDGSKDASGKMCDDYAKIDERIVVIHKENGGLSSARHAGLEKATGAYIGFVDSDDYILPQMYDALYAAVKSADACCAKCGYYILQEHSANGQSVAKPYTSESDVPADVFCHRYKEGVVSFGELLFCDATHGNMLSLSTALIKTEHIKSYTFWPRVGEDAVFFCDFALKDKSAVVALVPGCFHFIIKHDSNMTKITPKAAQDLAVVNMRICSVLEEYKIDDLQPALIVLAAVLEMALKDVGKFGLDELNELLTVAEFLKRHE